MQLATHPSLAFTTDLRIQTHQNRQQPPSETEIQQLFFRLIHLLKWRTFVLMDVTLGLKPSSEFQAVVDGTKLVITPKRS